MTTCNEPVAPRYDRETNTHKYIDPCEPLDIGYQTEEEATRNAYRDKELKEFLDKELAETVSGSCVDSKTREWVTKDFKRGYRVYIYPPTRERPGIVTQDSTRAAFEGLDLSTRGTRIDICNRREWDGLSCTAARDKLMAYKARLYQHYHQVTEEIGHIPCVSIERYHELIEKYGDDTPEPDISRYDMKEADQLMENGTLQEAADICECGWPWPYRSSGWEHGVYVIPTGSSCYGLGRIGLWHQGRIVAYDLGKVGTRDFPAGTLEEAKKIADGRNISIIRELNVEAAYYPNCYHFERDIKRVNIEKEPVISVKKNGEWVDVKKENK